MKILYAIQGTGNGHISRARDILPEFQKHAKTEVLISGIQSDVRPGFDVHHKLQGMGFIFGKQGNVDLINTFRKCVTRKFLQEIRNFPIREYDLIVNDFEPVSAWAARLAGVPCISLSHQFAVLEPEAPKPKKQDWTGKWIMNHYAPVSAGLGFHFKPYSSRTFTPVIRQQVRDTPAYTGNHITVYLPSYDNERLIKVFSNLPAEQWHIFSKHTLREFRLGNLWIRPIDNQRFLESMATSKAVLCGAGFETPAEALFLGKKLLVIPMKNQYEQQCNAAALAEMGVPTLKSLKKKYVPDIEAWLWSNPVPEVHFPDVVPTVVQRLLNSVPHLVANPTPGNLLELPVA
jgi:uncharacterized protein (TIGR00661 family)